MSPELLKRLTDASRVTDAGLVVELARQVVALSRNNAVLLAEVQRLTLAHAACSKQEGSGDDGSADR